ncbi:MAG: hypothetical protein U1F98_13230 [Verrucomicrobiota bacterium]
MSYLAFSYYRYKWEPPQVDEPLKQWLNGITLEQLREHLRGQSKQEWIDAWRQVRLWVIWLGAAFVVCLILGSLGPKGAWENILIMVLVGLFFSLASIPITVGTLFEYQFRRWRWFRRQKLILMNQPI